MLNFERNPLSDTLEQMIQTCEQNVIDCVPKIGCTREQALTEFRICALVTGRQTHTTARIVDLFNPETDVYVASSSMEIDMFKDRLHEKRGVSKNTVRYLNLKSQTLANGFTNISQSPIARVWFDVGGSLLTYRSVIHHVVRKLDEIVTPQNPIYIIV